MNVYETKKELEKKISEAHLKLGRKQWEWVFVSDLMKGIHGVPFSGWYSVNKESGIYGEV